MPPVCLLLRLAAAILSRADDLALELGDDLIFADSCTVTVYSVVSGQRTVRLPKSSTVWDLIRGGKVGRG